MRENKSFDVRLQELKEKYEPISEFDLIKVLELEDEYDGLTKTNPEHTKRRREILDMRYRLLSNLRYRPIEDKKDVYIDTYRDKCVLYYDGKQHSIIGREIVTFKEIADRICNIIDTSNTNIYIDTRGIGRGLANELTGRGIENKSTKCNTTNF